MTPETIDKEFHPSLLNKSALEDFDQSGFDELLSKCFDGKVFAYDWFTTKAPPLYHHLRDQSFSRILEIGVFEGRSALFFAEMFPDAHLTLVDVFVHFMGHEQPYEINFDKNMEPLTGRFTKIKGSSAAVLSDQLTNQSYDFIFIDADHGVGGVLIDAILSWRLLEIGGYILFDDYDWFKEEASGATRQGMNFFIDLIQGCFETVHADRQVLLKKTKDIALLQMDSCEYTDA